MAHPQLIPRARALALDFDGTLAREGVVAPETTAALSRAIERRVQLLLVTGRRLSSLAAAFPHLDLFERVVAENGAVLYEPRTKRSRILAPAPDDSLLEALRRAGVPFVVGHSVVATVRPFKQQVVAAIGDAGVRWHVAFNKNNLMILPVGVTKVTGLAPALEELGIAPAEMAGIGDAENDLPFLSMCGIAIAVANAVPSLKAIADHVTVGARGDGVIEAITGLFNGGRGGRRRRACQRRSER